MTEQNLDSQPNTIGLNLDWNSLKDEDREQYQFEAKRKRIYALLAATRTKSFGTLIKSSTKTLYIRYYKMTKEEYQHRMNHQYMFTMFFGELSQDSFVEGFTYDIRTLMNEHMLRLEAKENFLPIPLSPKRWNLIVGSQKQPQLLAVSRATGYLFYPLSKSEVEIIFKKIAYHPLICSVPNGCWNGTWEQFLQTYSDRVIEAWDESAQNRFARDLHIIGRPSKFEVVQNVNTPKFEPPESLLMVLEPKQTILPKSVQKVAEESVQIATAESAHVDALELKEKQLEETEIVSTHDQTITQPDGTVIQNHDELVIENKEKQKSDLQVVGLDYNGAEAISAEAISADAEEEQLEETEMQKREQVVKSVEIPQTKKSQQQLPKGISVDQTLIICEQELKMLEIWNTYIHEYLYSVETKDKVVNLAFRGFTQTQIVSIILDQVFTSVFFPSARLVPK